MLQIVVLPQPFGPAIAQTSPSITEKEIFLRQYSSADGYLYDRLLILTTSIVCLLIIYST